MISTELEISFLFPRPKELGYIVAGELLTPKMDLLWEAMGRNQEFLNALQYQLKSQLNLSVDLFLPGDTPKVLSFARAGNLAQPHGFIQAPLDPPVFLPDAVLNRPMRLGIRGLSIDDVMTAQTHTKAILESMVGWCVVASARVHYPGLHLVHSMVTQLQSARDIHEALHALLREIKTLSLYPDEVLIIPFTVYYLVHPAIANALKERCANGTIGERIIKDNGQAFRLGPALMFAMHSIADFDPYLMEPDASVVSASWAGWHMLAVTGPMRSLYEAGPSPSMFRSMECVFQDVDSVDDDPPGFDLPIEPHGSWWRPRRPHPDDAHGYFDQGTALGILLDRRSWQFGGIDDDAVPEPVVTNSDNGDLLAGVDWVDLPHNDAENEDVDDVDDLPAFFTW
ncbi:hypothetical protein GGF32_005770 [Allomyces javanicus]|nr:hypothetical protein GGF32_005770 [Allomyces javanicus]